jgi:NAD(P)-dependent dehydrogenase (short-subunit alcohol dehydrogenase family)
VTAPRLAGRRALVTGASRGIGAAIAERLAAEGADVAITARTSERHDHLAGSLRETAERLGRYGHRVATVVADLSDEQQRAAIVPQAVAALGGPIEILVNNAAAAIYQPLTGFPLKRRRLTFEVNVHAPVDLAQAVIPAMRDAGEGWILNLSSAAARPPADSSPSPPPTPRGYDLTVYGASKAALNRVTVGLAGELAGTGIRVNSIEPRAAVLSEGAAALVGDILVPDQIESMAQMVEAALVLCDCAADVTGRIAVSIDLLDEWTLPERGLDGTAQ